MSNSNARGAMKAYTQVRAHASVEGGTPHRLIQLLLEGALEKINKAKGHLQRKEIEAKVTHIDWAVSIIEGLQISLDREKGGQIAENLDNLYDYIQRKLMLANADNNAEYLDEVTTLLTQIKQGWEGIPAEVKNLTAEQIASQEFPALSKSPSL